MSKKRNLVAEIEFSNSIGSFQVYFPSVTINEAIDKLLKEANFRKKPVKIGTIKERRKTRREAGFLQQDCC